MRHLLIFILLISTHLVMAQDIYLKNRIRRIDSLMVKYYLNFEKANRETDELYKLLKTKYTQKKYKEYKVEVMLQKSILYGLNDENDKALQLSLEALELAKEYNFTEKIYRSNWILALIYEMGEDFETCRKYLDDAHEVYKENNLDSVYSVYCIRMSSYYSFLNKNDSALHYAQKGLKYATKYQNAREIRDSYLLLGRFLADSNYKNAIKYKSLAAKKFLELEDYSAASAQFTGASRILLKHNYLDEALKYSDTALKIISKNKSTVYSTTYEVRSDIFKRIGNLDSAYHYFKMFHDLQEQEHQRNEIIKIKQISEQYQNKKKEELIKSKNNQMILIVSLLVIIILATILLYIQNRKINSRNKIINLQLAELTKTLKQKQMLLSELQHRVKNNLQHVISILEIQKESVDFNNIEELIRENQNRIHSMALLHRKLNVTDNANEVELCRYVNELSELVKSSYDNEKKEIALQVKCEIENINIEKALPLGLIITELVSNSMKHAFKKQNQGIINIEILNSKNLGLIQFHFRDNGIGFDFNKQSEKGLGQEIIKGLIEQLNGKFETNSENGFQLSIFF